MAAVRLPFDLEWRQVGMALLIIIIIALSFFVIIRIRVTYRLETDLAILRQQITDQTKELADARKEAQKALDDMAVTVYGPLTTLKRRPSSVEIWQRNRDKELRDRIHRLEQWRYEDKR